MNDWQFCIYKHWYGTGARDWIKPKKIYQYSGTKAMMPGHQDFDVPPDLTGHSKFGVAPKLWCPGAIVLVPEY